MILIVCTDDDNGMAFANRRQSQDRLLRERLLRLSSGKLWLNAYSAKQFSPEETADFTIDEDFLEHAGANDFCFAETADPAPYAEAHTLPLEPQISRQPAFFHTACGTWLETRFHRRFQRPFP